MQNLIGGECNVVLALFCGDPGDPLPNGLNLDGLEIKGVDDKGVSDPNVGNFGNELMS